MKKSYTRAAGVAQRLRQLGLAALLAGGTVAVAQAQTLNYPVGQASTSAGTYTDLGTTGTVISTTSTDDANSAAQDIGFTFTYGGTAFTQFIFNTNGIIRLGSAAPSTAALYYDNGQTGTSTDPLQSTNAADVNLLMPFNIDLVPGTSGVEYRVATTGTAPNRVCTIQWKNVADKAGAGTDAGIGSQFANFSFQLKLYETTNAVDFVYGAATAGTAGAAGTRYPQVGLKAGGLAATQLLLGVKYDRAVWKTTQFTTTNYTTRAHDIIRTTLPDAGRTYHFGLATTNDVAIRAVYTLNKAATLGSFPQSVRVYIANVGTTAQTNLPVTLTVTGANSFTYTGTLASLAAGAAGYLTLTNLPNTFVAGTNTVTVSVPSDNNNYNNTASVDQLVSTNTMSYLEPSRSFDASVSYGAVNGVLVNKFTVGATSYLGSATLQFEPVAGNTNAYQVVVYNAAGTGGIPGAVLYTSPTLNRTAAGGSVTVQLGQLQVATGSFYVGIKELGGDGASIATQIETPLRSTTFYASADGATGWFDLATTTLPMRLAIDVNLAPAPNCLAPTNLAVGSITATSAVVTFTAAAATNGYELVYGPSGFQPTSGTGTTVAVTASPYTLTGLQGATQYDVYIRSVCSTTGNSSYAGPVSFSTSCAIPTVVSTFPYTESFDNIPTGQALPCGITVLDANADNVTWRVSTEQPNSGTRNIRYQGLLASVAANDWFFTPGLVLPGTANTRYQVAFSYRAAGSGSTGTSSFTEALEVKSGPAATVAGQTNLLFTNNSINNLAYAQANGTSTPVVAYLPAGASTQYVGFHVISPALQSNLYIDDLSVTAVT
ncbi:MAG: hypothetical protein EOO62_08705, partial [Hymenobacter sp.]